MRTTDSLTTSPATAPADSTLRPTAARSGWILAAALGVIAFLPSLRYPFLFDDWHLVKADPRLQPPLEWRALVWSPLWPIDVPPQPLWRPAFHLSLAMNRLLTGESSAGFRVVNFLLHGAVAALVWALVRALGGSQGASAAAGALFALHPVHTEAVVGIVGRAELQMALGTLLTVVWGLRSARTGKMKWALASVAAYAFALFSKEQGYLAIVLLILARAATRTPRPIEDSPVNARPARRADFRNAAVTFALLAAVALAGVSFRLRMFGWDQGFSPANLPPLDNPLIEVSSPSERAATGLRMFGRAAALSVFPARLSPDYSSPAIPVGWNPLPLTVVSGLFLVILSALTAVLWVRGKPRKSESECGQESAPIAPARLVAFGLAWFLITELPVSNLFVLNGTIFGDRLLYAPSVGVSMILGVGADRVFEWMRNRRATGMDTRRVAVWLRIVVVFGLLVWCWTGARPWRSALALYQHSVAVVPRSAKAHYSYGLALKDEGDFGAARRELVTAVGLWPRFALAWHELGALELDDGHAEEAEKDLRRALALQPNLPEAHNSIGNALAIQKRYAEALREFEIYRRLGPRDPAALERKIQHTRDLLGHPSP